MLTCLATGWPQPAAAQYFGQNKVQYKDLDFQILKTEHFDIYYYPSERKGVEIAARMAERWNARFERILQHTLRGRQPLVLYGSHPDFEQTHAIAGEVGEGTGGVTEPLRRRIVLPMGGPLADTDHVIGHELVHAFQFDMTASQNAPPGQNGAERLPLWFIEGMAEYLSLGPVDPNTAMWLRDAVRMEQADPKQKLPSIDDLSDPKYFPYRWGQALWAYIAGRYGDDVIRRMLTLGAAAGDPHAAIQRVLGVDVKQLSADWQDAMRQAYGPILANTTPPNEIGRLVIKATGLGGDLNVGPSLSPDGRLIAFLSQRSVFATDLYVADAATGKILHKLTSTATDPHYSSIQFIYSAGGWDSTGQRIAIATVVAGRPALAIFDAAKGERLQEIRLEGDLDEVFNPTWAPDDHAIAFTAMTDGVTDLFIYDLKTSRLRRVTDDAFAELMPAWSPDGARIAFATDRFSSNLNTLAIGQYRLAVLDVQSGTISEIRTFASGHSLNPQWAPDGRSLYFISNHDGVANLYRTALNGAGGITQVTRVGTGLSGITSTSPALSIAARAGTAAFSVYENGKYDIYAIDAGEEARREASAAATIAAAATLPPLDRRPDEVSAALGDPATGLPAPTTYPSTPYKPTLSLEGIAQPTFAVGASRFGAAIGGGIALQFGDMLGDHTLITAAQINSGTGLNNSFSWKNTAAEAAYLNAAHRWNWGVIGGQVPYLSAGFLSGVSPGANGDVIETDQAIVLRQTEQSAAGIVAYPFNRARRIELQAGVSRVSFDQIVETQRFSLTTGELLSDVTATTSLANPLTLGTSSAAFVSDTSNFGATSPVQGERYRLEAAPTFGSINFTNVLADYRRYFMPVPFYTIAGRVLHYGRYGSGSDDQRLFPMFLGYPNLVRGYDVNTFSAADCIPSPASACPAFDRLLGSRMLVGNLELRFPLLRPFVGESRNMYGPLPVEVAVFADGGVAWNSLTRAAGQTILGTGAIPHPFQLSDGVASTGVALRVNLFGFAIGEFDFSHPFQRVNQGWVFQFNLSPGF